MTDDPLDRDRQAERSEQAEQAVTDVLRTAPLPPVPPQVREQLEAALREAQTRREAGEAAAERNEAVVAASRRTAKGTFGPNPIRRKRVPDGRLRPRTIGA